MYVMAHCNKPALQQLRVAGKWDRRTDRRTSDSSIDAAPHTITERTHQTRAGSSSSPTAELLSGVVHGSGIAPLMFLIFVNKLAKYWTVLV